MKDNTIDYSQLQTYLSCPKRYYNKYILGLKKRDMGEGEQSRSFGQCVHKALELWHTTSLEAGIKWFKENYTCLENEKIRTVDNGVQLINNFVPWYRLNFHSAEILGVEVQDTYSIGDIQYTVKIDKVIKYNGNIYVVDYKTTTSKTHYYFLNFNPNMQVSGYCNYVRKKYGSCSGFIPMVMQMGHRQRTYKGEPAGFWCKMDYDIINRTKEQLDDFEENVINCQIRIRNDMTRTPSLFPKNEGNCMQYRGCEYRELCISCDDPNICENIYIKTDPYEYLKKEEK